MSAVSVSALASQWSAGSRPGATGAEIRGHLRPRGAPCTCLFSAHGHELRPTLPDNRDSGALAELIRLRAMQSVVNSVRIAARSPSTPAAVMPGVMSHRHSQVPVRWPAALEEGVREYPLALVAKCSRPADSSPRSSRVIKGLRGAPHD